eukprot:gene3144-3978_t
MLNGSNYVGFKYSIGPFSEDFKNSKSELDEHNEMDPYRYIRLRHEVLDCVHYDKVLHMSEGKPDLVKLAAIIAVGYSVIIVGDTTSLEYLSKENVDLLESEIRHWESALLAGISRERRHQYGGGVVHFDGSGDITIADSYMTLNLVADKGCVAFARGSCGIAITGSVMVNNTAVRTFLEGGVVCVAGGGDITITDSIMTNNSARNGGVAYGGEGGIVITDSIMTQNAANNGGVVYQDSNVGGFISISGSNMTRNFAGAYGYGQGMAVCQQRESCDGAVHEVCGGPCLCGTEWVVRKGSFGAVAYFSPVLELISAISITDSHMAQHSAGYGAIYGELDTTLTDSIFTHNSAETAVISTHSPVISLCQGVVVDVGALVLQSTLVIVRGPSHTAHSPAGNNNNVDGGVAHVGANLVIIGSNLSQNSAM